jgi:arylsulfatase A-like enzyme
VHGFDEFPGNLYHLNAEEEPEQPDYPKDNPIMKRHFSPRGVLDCKATDVDDSTEDERFGRVGKQTITDTGPLTRERMTTIEGDLLDRSLGFIDRAHQAGKPFVLWHNSTRMHVWTRLSERWKDKTGLGVYADGMQHLDWVVGELFNQLDELGIADNTVVVWATDNGAAKFTWPDGGTTPFRGEKGPGWEGGFRAPLLIRWPGKIAAGQVLDGIVSLEDTVATLMAAAGVPDVKEHLLNGHKAGEKVLPRPPRRLQPAPVPDRRSRRVTAARVLLLRRTRPVRAALQQLEGAFPGQGRLVRRCPAPAHHSAAGEPAGGPVRAAHGRAVLPGVCRRKAVDRAPRRRPHTATCGHVRGLPAAAGAARLQPAGNRRRSAARQSA